jgi:putative sigma-54 modulation protein
MNIEYMTKHFELGDTMRELVEGKLGKVVKFVEEPVEIRVTLGTEKHRHKAELHVAHRHGVIQATEEAEAMNDAVNAAVDKVEKQARRSRKKFMDKRRRAQRGDSGNRHWPVDVVERASVGAAGGHRVVKTSSLPIKPMTIDEAALQLEESKNEFFVFLDSTTDKISVLYKRKDSHFGLIAPDF